MKQVYVFGTGEGKKYFDRCLLDETCICGYIDNYKAKETRSFNGKPLVSQKNLEADYDYIIITLMQFEEVKRSLIEEGVKREKLICFFDFKDASDEENWTVIDGYRWRMELMWRHYINIGIPTIDNMGYELYADYEPVRRNLPKIINAGETAGILKKEKKCMARFGDGEFELICGRQRTNFQVINDRLSERLTEVLNSCEDNLLIAIADNYGSLEKYTEAAARDIRMYLTGEVRKNHMELLDPDRQYYDAYISRPYMIYRDKENAAERFEQVKEIWKDEDVLIIEGAHTRFGVGNDLLKDARSVKRIITPDSNAFSRYEEILDAAHEYGKGRLILAVLGPTATILAYDLARKDHWAIDIGQFDVEYEWFLQKAEKKCGLKYRNVSEVASREQLDLDVRDATMQHYMNEIVRKIL